MCYVSKHNASLKLARYVTPYSAQYPEQMFVSGCAHRHAVSCSTNNCPLSSEGSVGKDRTDMKPQGCPRFKGNRSFLARHRINVTTGFSLF